MLGVLEKLAADYVFAGTPQLPAPTSEPGGAVDAQFRIDPAEAWSDIEDFSGLTLQVPKALPSRLPLVQVVDAPAPPREPRSSSVARSRVGRSAKTSLDRVAFACYATLRWAGPSLAGFAARAFHVLGELRDPTPFIVVLKSAEWRSSHILAASALGILDDPTSRGALVDYLERSFTPEGNYRRDVTPAGVRAAVYGLAKLPLGGLATLLTPRERGALKCVIGNSGDPVLQSIANRVLSAWDENWQRDRLLYL